jgi:hypothetical protein
MPERRLSIVPRAVLGLLAVGLAAQVALGLLLPRPSARAQALAAPASADMLRVGSLGDPIPLAQALTLYLQAFDNQPGISLPFRALDYGRVELWLTRILELDPVGQYPLLLASQVYGQVPDPDRQRRMAEFAYRQFLLDPQRRWPWLAHAAIMAKHRLRDPELALRYARALRQHATDPRIPSWVRQMELPIYEDVGEYEAAKILLGGLLHSGQITDPNELQFLIQRLEQLKAAEKSSTASKTRPPAAQPPHGE